MESYADLFVIAEDHDFVVAAPENRASYIGAFTHRELYNSMIWHIFGVTEPLPQTH